MAITESVVQAVSERCRGRRVVQVTLVIGTLGGARLPGSLLLRAGHGRNAVGGRDARDRRGRGGPLPGCSETVVLNDFIALCPCGSADLEIVSGEELAIRSVEVGV